MTEAVPGRVPSGVRAIAAVFVVCGLYLATLGILMLLSPGTVPMSAGAPLLFGLELAGPYMFLLTAVAAASIAWGLMKRNNIMRRAAMLIAITGIVMLVPSVSAATVAVNGRALVFGGLGIIVRVIIVWYLAQARVADEFTPLSKK